MITDPWTKLLWRNTPEILRDALVTDQWHNGIRETYQHPMRHYHTTQHICESFRRLTTFIPAHPLELSYAILMHDIVYDVDVPDAHNVERSAKYAVDVLVEMGVDVKFDMALVQQLILATKHDDPNLYDDDRDIIRDIDMTILAEAPLIYAEYARGIMREYTTTYAYDIYAAGRKDFLTKLRSKNMFFTPQMHKPEVYVKVARNIDWELTQLS